MIHLCYLDSIWVWKLVKTRNLIYLQTVECIIDIHLFQLVMTGLSSAILELPAVAAQGPIM